MTQASAPGKIILFGEHAVVYGRPAIAVPLPSIRATVDIDALPSKDRSGIRVQAPDLDISFWLDEATQEDPLGQAIHLAIEALQATFPPNLCVTINSNIPIAAGLGSGAAVTVAIIRGLCRHFRRNLSNEQISRIAYEVERIHHGTPSGVDNTVITYEKPVYFTKDQPFERFNIQNGFSLVLAHSGYSTPTSDVVDEVRDGWRNAKQDFENTFESIGRIVDLAYGALKRGDVALLGPLMDQNQLHLQRLGVSCDALEKLINIAKSAGAAGAKLSGAGQGGFMIALVEPAEADAVMQALGSEGASHVLETKIA